MSARLIWWRARLFSGPWSVGFRRQNVAAPASAGAASTGSREQAEDHIGVAGRISDDLAWADAGLGVEQPVEDVRGVGLGAGDHDRMQPGVVVGGRAEQRDAAATVEVAAVIGGVDRASGDDEPQPVDRRDLAAAQRSASPSLAWKSTILTRSGEDAAAMG
jgi:hypothetical protein